MNAMLSVASVLSKSSRDKAYFKLNSILKIIFSILEFAYVSDVLVSETDNRREFYGVEHEPAGKLLDL